MIELVTGQQQQQQDADSATTAAAAGIDCTPEQQQQQQQLCDALSCLALHAECDEDVRRQLCSSPALLQRLTQLLQAADLHTAQLAAHLVWYVSRSAELRLFLQQQVQLMPALLGLLAGQDVAAARAAAFALNNCAHEQSFRFAMLEAGAVPCLVEMLSGCDALGQEVSCSSPLLLACGPPAYSAPPGTPNKELRCYVRRRLLEAAGMHIVLLLIRSWAACVLARRSRLRNLDIPSAFSRKRKRPAALLHHVYASAQCC
jgi:hypothetical protein